MHPLAAGGGWAPFSMRLPPSWWRHWVKGGAAAHPAPNPPPTHGSYAGPTLKASSSQQISIPGDTVDPGAYRHKYLERLPAVEGEV